MFELALPWEIYPLFFLVALLYSSVGHGGASGYLAIFALFGVATPSVAPIVLILNILVAATGFVRYRAEGHFSPQLLFPFVALSLPAAFIGGRIAISEDLFAVLLGVALLLSAVRILFLDKTSRAGTPPPSATLWPVGLLIGALLGLASGMLGIGGGVFLSPILLLAGWADVKRTAATSSAFIVLNSLGGLAGHLSRASVDFSLAIPLAAVVFFGGALGAHVGATRLHPKTLQLALAIVLLMAGAKLLGKGW